MDYNKIEDAVFKKAMDLFKSGAADFFNLDINIKAPANTEIQNINIKRNDMDYLFYTADGNYLHFEFQTTNKNDDISRFLFYDASLYYKSQKNIRTVVVYSSDIINVKTSLNCGTINYNVEAFYMKNLDGDDKLNYIKNKIEKNIELTLNDIMTLSFIPLMNSKKSKSEITLDSIEVANNITSYSNKNNCLMLLYALFDKFGDDIGKRRFKEVVSMTDVGKMIYEDGKNEGKAEGKAEGKIEGKADLLIKQLIKKFKILPDNYREKIMSQSVETIDIIATEIFDIDTIDDIAKYLQ